MIIKALLLAVSVWRLLMIATNGHIRPWQGILALILVVWGTSRIKPGWD